MTDNYDGQPSDQPYASLALSINYKPNYGFLSFNNIYSPLSLPMYNSGILNNKIIRELQEVMLNLVLQSQQRIAQRMKLSTRA